MKIYACALTHNYSQQHGSIVTKKQKQLKNPSPGERPTKMWAEQTVGNYSTTWGNEVLTHTTTRMKTRLHERTWSQRIVQRVIPLIWNLRIDSSLETKSQLVCLGLRGRWKEEGATDRYWEYSKIGSCWLSIFIILILELKYRRLAMCFVYNGWLTYI